jgi:hypothetical protein
MIPSSLPRITRRRAMERLREILGDADWRAGRMP